jgi:dihydroorotate dehydrogenase
VAVTAYDVLFDRVFTRVDPERAHDLSFRAIRAARPLTRHLLTPRNADPAEVHAQKRRPGTSSPVSAMGLTFPNSLGLAAGFDKNAVGIDGLAALGFGFVEVGTVTARPQPGNPKPRLFRLPRDRAIVNRMGFNNDGAEVVAQRLADRAERVNKSRVGVPRRELLPGQRSGASTSAGSTVVGVNIGRSKVVPEDDEAAVLADYATSARLLASYADYLVVNVSSPNTAGLRSLQAVDRLAPLLEEVRRVAEAAAGRHVPLCVKIAPDLADDDVVAVARLAASQGLDGIVATNTTVSRDGLASAATDVEALGPGGLSGPVLRQRSLDVLKILRSEVPDLALIGVGGVSTADDARERLAAGADLVQAYTGFVYGGPLWPRRVVRGLHE